MRFTEPSNGYGFILTGCDQDFDCKAVFSLFCVVFAYAVTRGEKKEILPALVRLWLSVLIYPLDLDCFLM